MRSFPLLLALFLLTCGTPDPALASGPALHDRALESLMNLPVRFLENKGQLADVNGRPAPQLLFKTESPGLNMYVTREGLTYLFLQYEEEKKEGEDEQEKEEELVTAEWKRVDMKLKDARITPENCIKEHPSENVSHYYRPFCSGGIHNVRSYETIRFTDIYPGIDWVLYNAGASGFKFDFIVHPGAQPEQIQLVYEGIGTLELLEDRIHFSNSIGRITEGELFCYQGTEKNKIGSSYQMKDRKILPSLSSHDNELFSYEIRIQVDRYDRTRDLVIDPLLTWGSFCSGSGLDGATTLSTDANGNVFISGYIASADLPVLSAGGGSYFQGTVAAFRDCFVMKFNNAGTLIWSTYYGGNNYDEASALAIDPAGNLFITGSTNSTDFPVFNPANGAYFQPASNGSYDAFVVKLSTNGALLWGTYFGGSADDEANSVCIDPQGNPILAGQTKSSDLPTFNPGGGAYYQPAPGSMFDGFIAKFTNAGSATWSTYIGGTGFDYGNSVSADVNGNIFLAGATTSNNFPTLNPGGGAYFQAAVAGAAFDAYVTKFTSNGVILWSTLYGGTGTDEALTIVNDPAGNVFVSGESAHSSFPTFNPGGGAFFQPTFGGGNSDGFILKFTNAGVRTWATLIGGSGDEGIDSHKTLAADDCGNIYVTFNTTSLTMPLVAPCMAGHYFDNSHNGGREIFLSKFSGAGVQTWGTYFSGSGDDLREAIDLDPNGNLFICGEWTSQNSTTVISNTYPVISPGPGAFYQPNFQGGLDDGYIAKFENVPVTASATSTPDACVCNGTATASATGGCPWYQYAWYNSGWSSVGNTASINNLCGGTYHVIVRDSVSCTAPDTATVIVSSTGGYVNLSQNVSICAGSSYTLPGGNIVSAAGTYIDTLAVIPGCDTIFSTQLSLINTMVSAQSATICSGNTYTLPGGAVVSAAGIYSDTLVSAGGCDSVITTTLTVISTLTSVQNPVICTGNSFTLPGGATVSQAGTYHDTLASAAGCDSIIITNLSVVPNLTHTQNISLCQGSGFTLPGGQIATSSGTYLDTLVSSGGCDSIITTNLTILPVKFSVQNPSICSDTFFILPGGAAVATTGIYHDTLVSANGCDSIVTTNLTVHPAPVANISGGTAISYGNAATLTASGGTSYNWSPPTGLNSTTGSTVIASPASGTLYCVLVTNTNGCTAIDCINISVEIICGEFFIPNAFSPNDDGENDQLKAYINPLCVKEFSLIIFNRWGQAVFETTDVREGWDGTVNDRMSNTGVYVYTCKAQLTSGEEIRRKGNVSLLR